MTAEIKVSYVDHMGDDTRVVQAARISFASTSEQLTARDEKLIKYMADHEHLTPFEHCSLSVVVDCPIYISKQIMRHRTFSYNEISRRYTAKDLQIFMPEVLREQSANNKQGSEGRHSLSEHWRHRIQLLHDNALHLYTEMLKDGICKEQARGALPQNTMTSFFMSGNLRNWAHFVKLRKDGHAQFEVQLIAARVEDLMRDHFPVSTIYLLKD